MKRTLLKVGLFSLFMLAACLFTSQAKASAATWCGVLAYAPTGNCLAGQDYTALTSLSGNSDQLKGQFINKMHNFDTGQHFQQRGAKYIEDTIGGCAVNYSPCSGWEDVVNQSQVTFSIENYSYSKNTAYDPGSDADIQYGDNDTRQSLVMKVGGVVYFAIKLDCGNPVGDLKAIPVPTGWSLSGTTTVNGQSGTITGKPGTGPYTFRHTVNNNGQSQAKYSWSLQDSNGGTYANGSLPNSGGSVTVGSNGSSPSGRTVNYTIPSNANDGDLYCQRVQYTNANGPNTATQNSTPACVRVQKNPSPHPALSYGCDETKIDQIHVNGTLTYVTLAGTDSDQGGAGYEVPVINGRLNLDLHYTAIAQSITVTTYNYQWNGRVWVPVSSTPLTFDCYHASCNPAVTGQAIQVKGNGPGDIVLAGQPFTVYVPVKNDNPHPATAETIPTSAGGYPFSLTEPPDDYQAGIAGHGTGFSLDPGETETAGISFNANGTTGSIRSMTLNFYPDFYGYGSLGEGCSVTFNVYQQFSATVSAQSDVSPTIENPTSVSYGATITHQWVNPPAGLPGHGINNQTNTSFYQKKAGGGQTTPCSPSSYSSSGPYNIPSPAPPGYDTVWSHNCAIAPGSFAAGDEFCSVVSAQYSGGYVGPDNNVVDGTGPATDTKCPRVVNEPYFKVNHSDISAGGDFDKCTTNGGTLAGYADISDPAGATRGSTAQLSALALLKITGVASAKTSANITGSPTQLTFANTGVQVDSGGNESPVLGGQFGGCRTLTNEKAPPSAIASKNTSSTPLINDISTLTPPPSAAGASPNPNAHVYDNGSGSTKLTINGGTLGPGQNVSVFVNGNVYISGNIIYGNGWQTGTAPSFILHATGNIYIAPGVKQLAGVYIAQQKTKSDGVTPDTTTGKIYDCADSTGFAPMSATNLYNGCKNQLVVYGSFVADQVNLMRSFGSLRDEIPAPGTPGVSGGPQVQLTWSSCGTAGSGSPGESCPTSAQLANLTCTNIIEQGDPNGWNDNKLCVPNSASSPKLAWTHEANVSDGSSCKAGRGDNKLASYIASGDASLNCLKTHGYQYCTQWNPPDPKNYGWDDNYLCMNQARSDSSPLIHFALSDNTNATTSCTKVNEIAESSGDTGWVNGYYLCVPATPSVGGTPATAQGPPFTGCSNTGAESDTNSCAGEIFEYSPALYLSNDGGIICPVGGCGGPLQLQSITSLPPVL